MNLSLMPYRLYTDYLTIADKLCYIDSYNGAKLYKVNDPGGVFKDIPLTDAHLYFVDGKLITIYLHLENKLDYIETLVKELSQQLGLQGVLSRSQFGLKYRWEVEEEVLVLVKDQIHRKFYIYYAPKKFSVY